MTGADFAKDFSLADHNGAPRTLADFRGRLVVIFFGFTHCPDVCPTTLAQMAKVMKTLDAKDASRVQVLFVTVDPDRDTAEILKSYVTAFDPGFLALWGDQKAIERTTREFKVLAMKASQSASGDYSVDHSTQTFVYDSKGRLRLFIPHSRIEEALGHDLRLLLKERS